MSWTAWDPAPLVLAGAAVTLMFFGRAFIRLRRRGRSDHAGWSRAALFVFAVGLGTLSLVSPLDTAAATSLSAHMLQHLVLGDVAPALALIALRGPLLFFLVPSMILRRVARTARLRAALAFVLRPRISLGAWAVVIAAWHIPAAYDYALTHPAAHELEHVSFVLVGLLAWAQIIDPARRALLRPAQLLACATGMLAVALALGGALLVAGPLYPAYAHRAATGLFALSPAIDQRLAGLEMLAVQLASLGVCLAFLLPAAGVARKARALPGRYRPIRPQLLLAASTAHRPAGADLGGRGVDV